MSSIALSAAGHALAAVHLLADSPAEPDKDKVTPGTLGFVVVFLLAVATLLLVRSMVGHLRKIRYSTPPGEQPGPQDGSGQA